MEFLATLSFLECVFDVGSALGCCLADFYGFSGFWCLGGLWLIVILGLRRVFGFPGISVLLRFGFVTCRFAEFGLLVDG